LALPARILAMAEKMEGPNEILVPCSACYLNLKKVEVRIKKEPEVSDKVNEILKEAQLHLNGRVHVRHLLDVLSKDLDPEIIRSRLRRSLSQFRIAPYYGCQCLRPYQVFDDPESPRSMEPLIEATGATIHPWKMGGRCCGASHMNTKMDVGLELVGVILKAAQGADAIVTVCPMCQINLEGYQQKVSKINSMDLGITVLYLPQLLGLAIGLPEESLGLDLNLSVTKAFRERVKRIDVPD
jgi:heterodisulfide reductase subunit B